MTFENLNLIEPILKALQKEGYSTPTPIQEKSIPILLQGKDLLGCAQTSSTTTSLPPSPSPGAGGRAWSARPQSARSLRPLVPQRPG